MCRIWEVGKCRSGEVGRLGSGEVGKLGGWEVEKLGGWEDCLNPTLNLTLFFLGLAFKMRARESSDATGTGLDFVGGIRIKIKTY